MKTFFRYSFVFLFTLLIATGPVFANASLSVVVATVNGNPISGEDFNWAFNRMQRVLAAGGTRVNEQNVEAVRRLTLQGLLKNELFFAENEALGMKVDKEIIENEFKKLKNQFSDEDDFLKTLDHLHVSEGTIRRQIMRGIAVRNMLANVFIPEVQLDDDATEKYFKDHPQEFHQPELVHVRHILAKVEKQATDKEKDAVRKKLEKLRERILGGEDFGRLAMEFSEDDSARNGGDLGFFRKGQLNNALDPVVFSLEPGQVSAVVESPFGDHLLEVIERRPARDLSYAEVKDDLRKRLVLLRARENAARFVDERMKTAEIKIYLDDLQSKNKEAKDE